MPLIFSPAPPPLATTSQAGLISTGTQSFAGNKTFTGTVTASNLTGTSAGTNTGDLTLTAVGSSPNSNAASLSGQALTLQPADGSNPGILTTGTQTLAGNKTLTGSLALTLASGNSLVVDTNSFVVDATNNRVGIGTASPSQKLEVAGTVFSTSGGFKFPDNSVMTTAVLPTGVFNVKAYGATGDGVTDDSANIQSAITAALVTGGNVFFPVGVYKCNISVVGTSVHLSGSATTADALGSELIPNSLTSPVLAIGNGSTTTNNIRVSNLTIKGTGAGASSDGLVVNGANYCSFDNLNVRNFGRDNIGVTSTVAKPTTFIYFNGLISESAAGDCLSVDYGPGGGSYTTGVFVNNFALNGLDDAAARALRLKVASLYLNNGWIGTGNAQGHVTIDPDGGVLTPVLYCQNVAMDSGANTDTLVHIAAAKGLVGSYIQGKVTIDGEVSWSSGTDTVVTGLGGFFADQMMSDLHISNRLNFGRADAGTDGEDFSSPTYLFRSGASPNQTLAFSSNMAFRPLGNYSYPVQFGAGGAVWRDANLNLRYDASTWWPAAITDGQMLSHPVQAAAPASGTWAVGDIVYSSDPATLGFVGWVCSVAGTPGTWRTFGPLTAVAGSSGLLTGSVADSGSAVANIVDNTITLATSGAKLLSVRNNTVEKAYVRYDGLISTVSNVVAQGNVQSDLFQDLNGDTVVLRSQVAEGGSPKTAVVLRSATAMTVAGSKLLSVQNATTEKLYVDKDGNIAAATDVGASLGVQARRWDNAFIRYFRDDNNNLRIHGFGAGDQPGTMLGAVTGAATALKVGNTTTLSTAGAKIIGFYSDNVTTEKAYIDKDGGIVSVASVSAPTVNVTGTAGLVITGSTTTAVTLPAGSRLNWGSTNIEENSTVLTCGTTFASSTVQARGGDSLLLQGRQADGASAVATILDNIIAFTTAGAKLLSIRNATVEKAYVDKDGGARFLGTVRSDALYVDGGTLAAFGAVSLSLGGNAADSGSAIAVVVKSASTYSTSGAKLLSVQNNTTEEAYIDYAGNLGLAGTTIDIDGTGATLIRTDAAAGNVSGTTAAMNFQHTATLNSDTNAYAFKNQAGTELFTINKVGVCTATSILQTTGNIIRLLNPGFFECWGSGGVSSTNPALNFITKTAHSSTDLEFAFSKSDDTKLVTIRNSGVVSCPTLGGTSASATGVTTDAAAEVRTFVQKVTVTEAALTDADTSQAVTIWTAPAKTRILRVIADVTTTFTGGGTTACTLQVGISGGDTDAYIVASNVFASAVTLGIVEADLGVALSNSGSGVGAFPNFGGTQAIAAQFDTTTANVGDLTTGSVTFYIEYATY